MYLIVMKIMSQRKEEKKERKTKIGLNLFKGKVIISFHFGGGMWPGHVSDRFYHMR